MYEKYFIGLYSKKNVCKILFYYYKIAFHDLKENNINILYFYKEDKTIDISGCVRDIENLGIKVLSFENERDIVFYLKKIKGYVYINTFEEQFIEVVCNVKNGIGQKTTNCDIFLNKYLQREALLKGAPQTVARCVKLSDDDNIKRNLSLPIVVKPVGGIQSAGVQRIDHWYDLDSALSTLSNSMSLLSAKGLTNKDVLLEEYIDGTAYSVDYFVDESQNINIGGIVKLFFGVDYNINDFCNIVRIISDVVYDEIDYNKLTSFVKSTVKGADIKNTFVHHEFKLTSRNELKTLEINGRIGGYRVEMYEQGYDLNLLSLPFGIVQSINRRNSSNIAVFAIYPKYGGEFAGWNIELLDRIYKLKSFFRDRLIKKTVGSKIGLTKDGFSKLGTIVLKNDNLSEFQKDLDFVNEEYFNLINIL